MIGILCTNGKEKKYSTYLSLAVQPIFQECVLPVLVFSLANVDLKNKTVFGIKIHKETIKPLDAPLPTLIFNFSRQCDKKEVKKLRLLSEIENVTLINQTNRYNQWMIMEILSSSDSTRKYLLPYKCASYDSFKPHVSNNLCIIPRKGASCTKMIYIHKTANGYQVYKNNKSGSYTEDEIASLTDSQLLSKQGIIMECPTLLLKNNQPVIVRVHLQKRFNNSWCIVKQSTEFEYLNKTAEMITKYVNRFLPSLGMCFVDFLLDNQERPYFLHLGGWDYQLLRKSCNKEFYYEFFRNLLDFANC